MKRVEAVKGAMASMEMEGFIFTEEDNAVFERLSKGEISYDDVKKVATDKLKLWQIENPECSVKEK